MTQEQENSVIRLYMNDLKLFEIAKATGIESKEIKKFLSENGYLVGGNDNDQAKENWLNANWKFKIPKKVHRTVSANGYRVVHKGEHGICTMYRPDGMWR